MTSISTAARHGLLAAIASCGVLAGPAQAQDAAQGQPQNQASIGDDGWQVSITPYVWVPSISGDFRYHLPSVPGGGTGGQVHMGGKSLLQALNFAAMAEVEARHGRYSLLGDIIYLSLGTSSSTLTSVDRNPGAGLGVSTALDAATATKLRGSLMNFAGGYSVLAGAWGHLDVIAGVRLLPLHTSTELGVNGQIAGAEQGITIARDITLHGDTTLVDGVAGLRGQYALGQSWYLSGTGDIGGGSATTWQLAGAIAWRASWADISLGYRHLAYDQGGHALVRKLSFSGPYLALKFPL